VHRIVFEGLSTVTVRNPESRKDFAALVVSENRVQVRF
jgi:hypothetical protein